MPRKPIYKKSEKAMTKNITGQAIKEYERLKEIEMVCWIATIINLFILALIKGWI